MRVGSHRGGIFARHLQYNGCRLDFYAHERAVSYCSGSICYRLQLGHYVETALSYQEQRPSSRQKLKISQRRHLLEKIMLKLYIAPQPPHHSADTTVTSL
jgi:hypothetical protein